MINFALVISISIFLLYIIFILISFNPADPGWSQITWHESIHNIGGILGAKISDFLFFIFGVLAYIIPFFILFCFWSIYLRSINITIFVFLFKLLGVVILLLACCGLAHLIIDDCFYFSSGGVIGNILCDFISSYEQISDRIQLALFLFIGTVGIIVLFNNFFLMVLKSVKKKLYNYVSCLGALFFYNIKHKYQIYYRQSCNILFAFLSFFSILNINCLKNLDNNASKKNIISTVLVEDVRKFPKQLNITLKQDPISRRYIFVMKQFVQSYNFLKSILLRYKLYINKTSDDCYKKRCKKNIFSEQRNSAEKINKHDAFHVYDDLQMFCSEEKLPKCGVSLVQDYSSEFVDNIDKYQTPVFVDTNIKKNEALLKNDAALTKNDKKYFYNSQKIIFPALNLLVQPSLKKTIDSVEIKKFSQLLEVKLSEYNLAVSVANVTVGPVITRFDLNLSPGIKSSRIVSLSRDLARVLHTIDVRVIEVIPGTPYVGLEIPNKKRNIVYLGNIINSKQFKNFNTPLALVLGSDISGQPVIIDLRSMPHLLIAGTTGSGKSVGVNVMIVSILYKATPEEVRFIMIDPKILELSVYAGIPHLLQPVITDTQEVNETLQWCIQEMERRYKLMAMLGVRNLGDYNYYIEKINAEKNIIKHTKSQCFVEKTVFFSKKLHKLPYIVIIVDEFSDLMLTTTKKVEELVIRLTQKARAAGIHIVLATQRPSVDVITGLIKANIPARIAFAVSSKIDSRTILGQSGAESLLGMGDMLYLGPNASTSVRVHGAFVEDKEIRAVVNFWKNKQ